MRPGTGHSDHGRMSRISGRVARSPNLPPSPSTPRRRRCRPREKTSSVSVPANPTSPHRPSSSRPRPRRAPTRATTSTRPPPACPSCAPPSPRRRSATRASTSRRPQVVVTNGGKHAVYNTFQVLLDPGDEVIIPAPYWTTYPEAVKLADGVPVEVSAPESAGFRVTVDHSKPRARRARKPCCSCRPSNPTAVRCIHTTR